MTAIGQDINAVVRTVYGTYLQTIKTLGLPFTLIENTTLNERFNVQSGALPPAGTLPSMAYLAIGNRGHITVQADDGSDETVAVPHRATDAGLFNQIPFVLREVGNDLPANEREKYAIRVLETHNNVDYWAYYIRRIDLNGVTTNLQKTEIVDDNLTTTSFVPTAANLNPDPPDIPDSGVIVGSNSAYSASAVLEVALDSQDIAEIMNAHEIRTGSNRSPVISELALCSGIDKTVQGNTGGSTTFNYDEVIACQVNVHMSTYHAVGYSTDSALFTIDVGGVEPMLGEDNVVDGQFV